MGGTVSRFNETDWNIANGGLQSSSETIDGTLPTPSYRIYHLVKAIVFANQREFTVIDDDSNLVYMVKPSPGTIAGFDVLGVGSATVDDYRLRVTVDLARRNWIVYRFHEPVFDGQEPDRMATEKFAEEQGRQRMNKNKGNPEESDCTTTQTMDANVDIQCEEMEDTASTTIPVSNLYKVCCVTVSWSRYMAVAAQYGSPSEEQILGYEANLLMSRQNKQLRRNEESSNSIASSLASALRIPRGTNKECNSEEVNNDMNDSKDLELLEQQHNNDQQTNFARDTDAAICENLAQKDLPTKNRSLLDDDESLVSNESNSTTQKDVPPDPRSFTNTSNAIHTSLSMPELTQDDANDASSGFSDWWKRKSGSFQISPTTTGECGKKSSFFKNENIKPSVGENPLEGVIDLEKPLLLCQEIFTKIIGNHQTCRITKSQFLTLLKQDIEQHKIDVEGANHDKNEVIKPETDEKIVHETSLMGYLKGYGWNTHSFPKNIVEEDASSESIEIGLKQDVSESEDSDTIERTWIQVETCQELQKNNGEQTKSKPPKKPKDEPLVAYWSWENSLRVHKMKMHLAKGSDLALHVVMAVIVNQVRYERNAIAATV